MALPYSLHWTWRFSKAYIGIDSLIKIEVDNGLDALVKCIMNLTLYRPYPEKGSEDHLQTEYSNQSPTKSVDWNSDDTKVFLRVSCRLNHYKHVSHFSYSCKMRCPLNLVLEYCKYLWFYWTFCVVILDCGLKLHKLSIHTLVMLQKWLEIH